MKPLLAALLLFLSVPASAWLGFDVDRNVYINVTSFEGTELKGDVVFWDFGRHVERRGVMTIKKPVEITPSSYEAVIEVDGGRINVRMHWWRPKAARDDLGVDSTKEPVFRFHIYKSRRKA